MKTLRSIKSGVWSRGVALARVSVAAGARAATHAMGNLFTGEDTRAERLKSMLYDQAQALTKELGQLKGSLMKVGQLLSMYGERWLPPEANALLKSLQSQSPPLAWEAVERVLRRQLGPEKLALLEIDPEPHASASLGQVHRARRREDGAVLALKIQYPGVDKAIESDLRALRSMLTVSRLVPKGPRFDDLFREVRQMLHQEVDYEQERAATDAFRARLAGDPRYLVPETFPEFSTARVLATRYEEGVPVDSPEVLALPFERRRRLGLLGLELYFRELFEWGEMQTDPHFGNYRVRLGRDGEEDRLILLDFGAVRKFPRRFLETYYRLVRGGIYRDFALVERACTELGFFLPEDGPELKREFAELCYLICEPFGPPGGNEEYDWAASDLPTRAMRKGAELAFRFKLRPPPREAVFLDRKMGGVFIFLSVLGVRARTRELLERYVDIATRRD